MTGGLEGFHYPGFLVRGQFGKDGGGFGFLLEGGVVHVFQVTAQEDVVHRQAHLAADAPGGLFVIPGEHLGGNPVVLQGLDGGHGGILRRIQEGQVAHEDHVRFVLGPKGAYRRGVVLPGQADNPHAFVVEPVSHGQDGFAQFVGHGHVFRALLGIFADGKHFFHGPFGNHPGAVVVAHYQHRQAPAGEVKGNLVHLGVGFGQVLELGVFGFFPLRPGDDGPVHKVLVAGLEVAVQVRITQHPLAGLAKGIQVVFQGYPVLGQGPCLIRTQHVHGSKALDGVQAFHHGLFLAHGNGALGQAGGNNHGQHFRGQAHGYGNPKQEGVEPVPFGQAVDYKDDGHHGHHKADQNPGYGVDALGKVGFRSFLGHGAGQTAKQGVVPAAEHQAGGRTADDVGAHKG